LPELENLPNKYLFYPWKAPKSILDEAGVILGENYLYSNKKLIAIKV
jgi:deoxyribodipyrimidine photo-lyase